MTCSDLVYQLSASKKRVEEVINQTLSESRVKEEEFEGEETSNTAKRNRKRKSYGEDFELEMVDEDNTTNEESDGTVSVNLTDYM